MRSRLSQNTLILLANNLGTALLAMLLSLQLGRGLGDKGFGAYAAIMAWILPLTLLADSGISTFLTRQVAQNPQLTAAYLQQAIRLRWLICGLLWLILWILAPWLVPSNSVMALRIGAGLMFIDNFFGVYTALWRAKETMLPILGLNLLLLFLQILGTLAALHANLGLTGIFAALVGADAIQLGLTWYLWRRFYASRTPRILTDFRLMAFWRAALPLATSSVLVAIQARLLFILLENLNGQAVLGWFAAASRFIEAAKMPPFALFGALFPILASQSQRIKFWQIQAGLATYAILLGLTLTIIATPLIRLTFGEEFSSAAPLLVLLGWAMLPLLLRQGLITRAYAQNQEGLVNQIFLGSLPVQAILGSMLMRHYPDGRGAALAFMLTEILILVWLMWGKIKPEFYLAGLLMLIALGLRWEIRGEFDGLYGQDAFAYYNYGQELKTAIAHLKPPPPMYWGLGYPSLLASSMAIGGENPQSLQFINLLLGAGITGLTVLIIHETMAGWPARHRLIASGVGGLLMAVTGQTMLSSLVMMSDIPALFWAMSSVLALYYATKEKGGFWIIIAALLLAWAGMTRWIYFLLALPWVGFAWRHVNADRRIWMTAGGIFMGLVLVQVWHSQSTPQALAQHEGLNWSIHHLTAQEFTSSDGTFQFEQPIGQFYAETVLRWLHPIFYPLLALGYWGLIRKLHKNAPFVWLWLAWLVIIFLYLGGLLFENPRFILAFYPPIIIMVGIGAGVLMKPLERLPIFGWVINGLIVLSLLLGVYETYNVGKAEIETLIHRKQIDLAAVQWLDSQIPEENARVYTLNLWLMAQFYAPNLQAEQIYYETPTSLEGQTFEKTYVFLNLWVLEEQWVGKAPWTAYHWLEDERGLIYLGRYNNYHLWRVTE